MFSKFKKIGSPLLAGTVIFIVCSFLIRLLFYENNLAFFPSNATTGIFAAFIYGIRNDLVALLLIASPSFALLFFKRPPKAIVAIVYIVLFCSLQFYLMISFIDINYFAFCKHKMTIGVLSLVKDSASAYPAYLWKYKATVCYFLIFSCILQYSWYRFFYAFSKAAGFLALKERAALLCILLVIYCITLFDNRFRPYSPYSDLSILSSASGPLAQNSFHTFVYSLTRAQTEFTEKKYFTDAALKAIYNPVKEYWPAVSDTGKKRNVVIFILESFARNYLTEGDPYKASTPFLDSILKISTVFTNAYSNGYESNHGIVSILSSMPTFTNEPFFYSLYSNTKITEVGTLFNNMGYTTNFFFGAGVDHGGFGKYMNMIGVKNYYNRYSYGNQNDYDNTRGIYDAPFLQYFKKQSDTCTRPFFSIFFNASSHPPYNLPADFYKKNYQPGKSPAQNSIQYVDYAFKNYFDSARNSPWFANTIFIFCADHFLQPGDSFKGNNLNISAIPLFIFTPSNPKRVTDSSLACQLDVLPTILGLVHFKGIYAGFGNDLSDTTKNNFRFTVQHVYNQYQVISDEYVLGYNLANDTALYFYHYKTDPMLLNNLISENSVAGVRNKHIVYLRAFLQTYFSSLNKRDLFKQ